MILKRQMLGIVIGVGLIEAVWANPVHMGIRNDGGALAQYCIAMKCKTAEVQTDAREFANGNTFVRFKESVARQDVVIVVPQKMDANQFIETLIKVRTSKTEFANSVKMVTEKGGQSLQVLDADGKTLLEPSLIYDLLAEAGLEKMDGKNVPISKKTKTQKVARTIVVNVAEDSLLAKNLGAQLGIPVLSVDQALTEVSHQKSNVILMATLGDPHNQSLFKSLQAAKSLKDKGVQVTFESPYLAYARSDKKDQAGVSVIGRLAADLIQATGVDSVQFVRAHAPQSEGFFSVPAIQTTGRKTINSYLNTIGVQQVISPDAGFQKDATLYADELGVPVSVINKQRDLQTGESKLVGIAGPSVAGKVVVITDDETASGGTLGKAAELAKKEGAAKVIAVVTHLAGNAAQALSSPFIDEMVVTDTFEVKIQNPKLKVLSLAAEMAADLKKMLGVAPICAKSYRK